MYGNYIVSERKIGKTVIEVIHYILEKDGTVFIAVDQNTVGQATGLCDRNNVEIYEGDIVLVKERFFDRDYKYIVRFGNFDTDADYKTIQTIGFFAEYVNDLAILADYKRIGELPYEFFDASQIKVIGNIHEEEKK